MSGRAPAFVAAPAADASRVAAIRNTIDLTDAAGLSVFGDRARREVIGCVDRLLAEVRGLDVAECDEILGHAARLIGEFDLMPLDKRGLFGNGKRLKAVQDRFRDADATLAGLSADLRERTERLHRKSEALEGLHGQTRVFVLELDAYLDAGRAAVAAAPRTLAPVVGEEDAPIVQIAPVEQTGALERRLKDLTEVRAVAIKQLPLVRVVQNVDAPLVERVEGGAAAVDAFRGHWRELLGLDQPGRRIRPDRPVLEQTRAEALDALAKAQAPLAGERARREDAERRMQTLAHAARG